MERRDFLKQCSVAASGLVLANILPSYANAMLREEHVSKSKSLFDLFTNPENHYRPFVRWWWNGDKIEKTELARELRILKEAGIGGVEINPISFPLRTDDMNKPSVDWLSDEWIELLNFTLEEAKSLDMTCDLLVGTGFPMGGAFLEKEECSQIVVIAAKKLKGPLITEFSLFDLYKEADPAITSPYTGRTMEMLEVKLVPDPLNRLDEVINLSDQIKNGMIKVSIPKGDYAIYGLVKIERFMSVIQGAPGGMGPVLNHYDTAAVKKYLNRMSDTIQQKIGPLAPKVRSFFVDSLETEGTNWNSDMMSEFQKRRGYDLYPYLPFVLFKIGGMGNTTGQNILYPVKMGHEFKKTIDRMRYDFELTKAEIFEERFLHTFTEWCKDNKIKSRAQAYGRGYFPLEGSFDIDIPECETWLKYGIGEDISEEKMMQYPWHLGRGNTMINKFVSSAAHLKDKKLISSEELTNTDMVFNESLEIFKIAGDQSTISGVTHPVFHGFNYSPPDAAFPGWITYGGYFSEKNTMWPYFKHYTDYRARLSAVLQQATMFADIALLAPFADQWSEYGAQNEPFPVMVSPAYQALIWESIHQNGNACDYVSERVINDSEVSKGFLTYGKRKYHTLFLLAVHSLDTATAGKLHEFVSGGGRIFCIEAIPDRSTGWAHYEKRDQEVQEWVKKMQTFPDRFIFLPKPTTDFLGWYKTIQEKYDFKPYLKIKEPKTFITQVRYQTNRAELFMLTNSSSKHSVLLDITFDKDILKNKQPWLWDAVTGKRFKLDMMEGRLYIDLGPADSKLIVFDHDKKGNIWKASPLNGNNAKELEGTWDVEFRHYDGTIKKEELSKLIDLKEMPVYANFAGTAVYRNTFQLKEGDKMGYINLGNVYGICEIRINGVEAGTQWYGRRIYPLEGLVRKGNNEIEIKVVTVMVNYMKTLKDNVVAQYWTNQKKKEQPLQSMGLVGPVTIY
ncbi:glycosyl hydrolase [Chryseobacterium paridis]|uniref:Twin-arginine translocation signal domain-containing protein n=1 Tax=Chryseobacterium paridis TaxID=2800328 RepID=A0ABS1FY28_9FLAO|nr:glycosyl hydrolase [Chryseobacterium paridis]MBK1897356.1 twin-arginine translocation signal domain-containing protein [Chryseobacterium paridis]